MKNEAVLQHRRLAAWLMTPEARMRRFKQMQEQAFAMMSKEGRENFILRNHRLRSMVYENGRWRFVRDLQSS
ncbi:MAG: hypothetical protein PHG44_00550 [Lentisphaeria bacterium]|nr:hypothetical protein [Lentisphaeria bacterium]MDY0177244.1 hypothetical protein [Lentisphaeria bacterium]